MSFECQTKYYKIKTNIKLKTQNKQQNSLPK